MNWLDFVDWQPGYSALKVLGLLLVFALVLGFLLGTRNRIKLIK